MADLESPINQTSSMSLDCWRKTDYLERIHAPLGTERAWRMEQNPESSCSESAVWTTTPLPTLQITRSTCVRNSEQNDLSEKGSRSLHHHHHLYWSRENTQGNRKCIRSQMHSRPAIQHVLLYYSS